MNPVENYCRQFHFIDVACFGRCQMCGGTGLMAGHDEPQLTAKEYAQQEQESHSHP